MTRSRRSLWQASVVCLFLCVAVVVGMGAVTANNPFGGTVASELGTNTGTVNQMLTPDASGNLQWVDVPTNSSAGGGGGGSITSVNQYIWADSVPLESTNPPAIEFATNTVSSMGFPYMAFDKDAAEWVGPQTIHTEDNWNSNITFEIDSWAGATGIVQYLFRMAGVDGVSVTYTSAEYVVNSLNITNMDSHTWALNASDFNAGTYYAYEFSSQVTNLITGAGARSGDHRVQQVLGKWISE